MCLAKLPALWFMLSMVTHSHGSLAMRVGRANGSAKQATSCLFAICFTLLWLAISLIYYLQQLPWQVALSYCLCNSRGSQHNSLNSPWQIMKCAFVVYSWIFPCLVCFWIYVKWICANWNLHKYNPRQPPDPLQRHPKKILVPALEPTFCNNKSSITGKTLSNQLSEPLVKQKKHFWTDKQPLTDKALNWLYCFQ